MLFYVLCLKVGRETAKKDAASMKVSLTKIAEMNARSSSIRVLDSSTNAYTTFINERKK
ncbi:hypothetical protein FACS189467_9010 [Bacteroidia bacterium]|nr:hypothetical protein FACS189467_9010 [Bacteroidia bacterium]